LGTPTAEKILLILLYHLRKIIGILQFTNNFHHLFLVFSFRVPRTEARDAFLFQQEMKVKLGQ